MRQARRFPAAPASAVAAALVLLLGAACARSPEASRPIFRNLVVVMIDTLRSDHLPSYGYERATAPYLERLAAEGIQLQGYSASSWTRSSIATLLTGLHPQRHGAVGRLDRLPEAAAYLPELLAERGFATAGLTTNGNVSSQLGFGRGYRAYADRAGERAPRVTDEALELAASLEPPFFLYAHYIDPHAPYLPAAPWGESAPADRDAYLQPPLLIRGEVATTPESVARLRDLYDAVVLETDRQVERLLEGLEERGLLEDTLVVVTADHGEEFAEHGGFSHGATLFEEVLEVPLIFWARSGLEGYRSAAPFHQVDFLPTVLDALGLPAPEGVDGRSRWGEVAAGAPGEQPAGGEPLLYHLELDAHSAAALRAGELKLLRDRRAGYRLYDLAEDPGEARPLEGPEARRELVRELFRREWRLAGESYPREQVEVRGEVREQLEALGYLGGSPPPPPPPAARIPAELSSSLDLRRPGGQLLDGWLLTDPNGTWSAPRAQWVLPANRGPGRLVLRGHSPGTARSLVSCRLRAGEGDAATEAELEITPGPFEAEVPLPPSPRGEELLFVEVEITPPLELPGVARPAGLHWQRIELVED